MLSQYYYQTTNTWWEKRHHAVIVLTFCHILLSWFPDFENTLISFAMDMALTKYDQSTMSIPFLLQTEMYYCCGLDRCNLPRWLSQFQYFDPVIAMLSPRLLVSKYLFGRCKGLHKRLPVQHSREETSRNDVGLLLSLWGNCLVGNGEVGQFKHKVGLE